MSRLAIVLAILAAASLAALGVGAAQDLRGAVHGWLAGFIFASLAAPGALIMILIARLTSSPWGEHFGGQLRAIAATAPLLWLLGLPVAVLLGEAYPWARGRGEVGHLALYLSPAAFLGRAVVALGGWTLLAWLVHRRAGVTALTAALGLVFQAVVLTVMPTDWALSVRPGWTTTDIGMTFLTLEVAFIAAAVLLFGPAEPAKSRDDIAGFLIAGVLGLTYMTFVAYLVDWYGDVPDRVGWWLERLKDGRWGEIFAPFVAALLVFLALAAGRRYRLAGAIALFGIGVYCVWLFAPNFEGEGWLVAPAGVVFNAAAIGLLAIWAFARRSRREAAHV
ncbi:MAG: hypothetical protein ACREEW_12955 [Caulobacteraceae bacterium]